MAVGGPTGALAHGQYERWGWLVKNTGQAGVFGADSVRSPINRWAATTLSGGRFPMTLKVWDDLMVLETSGQVVADAKVRPMVGGV